MLHTYERIHCVCIRVISLHNPKDLNSHFLHKYSRNQTALLLIKALVHIEMSTDLHHRFKIIYRYVYNIHA